MDIQIVKSERESRPLWVVCSRAGEGTREFAIKYGKKSDFDLPDSKASMAIRFPGRKWVFESMQASQVHGNNKG